jgi:hypothetical protein
MNALQKRIQALEQRQKSKYPILFLESLDGVNYTDRTGKTYTERELSRYEIVFRVINPPLYD